MQAFEDALAEAVDELQAAPVIFRAAERALAIAKVKLRTAQADPAYQATLAGIIATGPVERRRRRDRPAGSRGR